MGDGFWMGLFAFGGVIVTAVAGHIKNVQQDKSALKRDLRINALEIQHQQCEQERIRLADQLNNLLAAKFSEHPGVK